LELIEVLLENGVLEGGDEGGEEVDVGAEGGDAVGVYLCDGGGEGEGLCCGRERLASKFELYRACGGRIGQD
jgi:hypothetical protein